MDLGEQLHREPRDEAIAQAEDEVRDDLVIRRIPRYREQTDDEAHAIDGHEHPIDAVEGPRVAAALVDFVVRCFHARYAEPRR